MPKQKKLHLPMSSNRILESSVKPRVPCGFCGKTFSKMCNLVPHIRIHTGEKPLQCKVCGRRFSDPSNLSKHMRTHSGERPFSCHFCPRTYTQSSSLNTHLRKHTSERPFLCQFCPKTFSNSSTLASHQRTHLTSKEAVESQALAARLFEEFSSNERCFTAREAEAFRHISPYERPFQCQFCVESFADPSTLTAHLQTHLEDGQFTACLLEEEDDSIPDFEAEEFWGDLPSFKQEISSSVPSDLPQSDLRIQCQFCMKTFAKACNLASHMRVHTGEKPLQCNECGKRFSDPSNLAKHRRTHTGERPYQCQFCAKRFSQSSSLNTHVRIHTGEKPFSCHFCGKSFSNSSTLNSHLRKHTGERPFQCDICAKAFSNSSSLSTHMKSHVS